MKIHILLTALWSLFAITLRAQQTFTLVPNPVYGVQINTGENVGEATVTNLSSTVDTFRWTRTIIRLDYDSLCETQVTDATTHWAPFANNKTFWLEPGDDAPFNVALWDFSETGCCAIVHMKLKKLNAIPDSIEAFYYLRTCQPLAATEAQKATVELFPNPVGQYFSLRGAPTVSQMTLCDANGKMLRRIQANAEQRYEMAGLPAGEYYLILENKEGQIIQALSFVKG